LEAVRTGDTARGSRLQFSLLAPSRKIAGELGPTGVKYAMECVGYYGGGPRLPLVPLTEAQKKTVESVLAESIARQKLDHLGVAS
jgi:4-hydroxy-2-oxoglutarate aldolase